MNHIESIELIASGLKGSQLRERRFQKIFPPQVQWPFDGAILEWPYAGVHCFGYKCYRPALWHMSVYSWTTNLTRARF